MTLSFRCALIFWVVFFPFSRSQTALAQAATLTGVVSDSSGTPLPGVNIVLEGTNTGAATNALGRFEIRHVPAGRLILVFSAVGFRTARVPVEATNGAETRINVILSEIAFTSGQVLVTASRREQLSTAVPVSFSVISAKEIEVRNIVSLDQALRYVSGVQVMDNQVNIRGSSGFSYNVGSRVLMLLDGVPLLTPDSDGIPFDALPFAQIEQIEIIKGPGSALFGSGALGGTINVITKSFPDEPNTTINAFYGVHDPVDNEDWIANWPGGADPRPLWGLTVSHARRVNTKVGFWLNFDVRSDRGYANFNEEELVQVYAKLGWKATSTTTIDVLLAGLHRTRDNFLFWNGLDDALNPGSFSEADPDDPIGSATSQTTQLIIAPSLRQILGRRFLLQAKLRFFGVLIYGVGPDGSLGPRDEATVGFRLGGETQLDWDATRTRHFVFGTSVDANSTESPFFLTSDDGPIGNQPEFAVFGQYEEQLFNRLNVVLGLRFSAYQIERTETVTKLSPKIAVSYAAGLGAVLRAAFGQGFRVPSLAERFIDNQDFLPLFRNLTLRPEESTSYEAGIRWLFAVGSHSLRLDVAAFYNTYDDLIEPKLTARPSEAGGLELGFQFQNVTSARIVGIESSVDVSFPRGLGSAYAGYTFMDSEDIEDGLPLPFRPAHLLNAGGLLRPHRLFELGIDGRFASEPERVDSDFVLFVPDADVLYPTRVLDYWMALTVAPVRLAFHAKNMFDYYYLERPAYLAAPRQYVIQLRVDL